MIIIDVRSENEYTKGHIPQAINIPLLDNQARHEVGLVYKTEGFQKAFLLALEKTGPKMAWYVSQALCFKDKTLKIYCARGGMRSSSMAWLYQQAKFHAEVLPGGYKHYRNNVLTCFTYPFQLRVIGGFTGVGKTKELYHLQQKGEQIIDLEALAEHRGSAFGKSGKEQPTTELFENRLHEALKMLDLNLPIWVEDESKMIGRCAIPSPFYQQMQSAPLTIIEKPTENRVESILQDYAPKNNEERQARIEQLMTLRKRLGHERTEAIIGFIQNGNDIKAIEMLLPYYDQGYLRKMGRRK